MLLIIYMDVDYEKFILRYQASLNLPGCFTIIKLRRGAAISTCCARR
jgi:hypothetical protein